MQEKNPFKSIHATITTSSRDWSLDKKDAWIYGIIIGWGSAVYDVAKKHHWEMATTERLKLLHKKYMARQNGGTGRLKPTTAW